MKKNLKLILFSLISFLCLTTTSCEIFKHDDKPTFEDPYINKEYKGYMSEIEVTEPVPYEDYLEWSDMSRNPDVFVCINDAPLSIEKGAVYTLPYAIRRSDTAADGFLTRKQRRDISMHFELCEEYYVHFSSSNEDIATVDSDGNIFTHNVGKVIITAHHFDSEASLNIEVIEENKYKDLNKIEAEDLAYSYSDFNENQEDYLPNYSQSKGELNLLIIPIYFLDSFSQVKFSEKTEALKNIEEIFFGDKKVNGWQSVKTFYETESNNQLKISGTVSDWYTPKHSALYYEGDDFFRINQLLKEAIDSYFKNSNDNRSDYDKNNDKIFDGVGLVFAKAQDDNGYAFACRVQNYYPESGYFEERTLENPGYDHFMILNTGLLFDDGSSEESLNYDSGYAAIHETGHLFGLEDYYDYSGEYFPVSGMSLQDTSDAGHDPFSCLSLDWATAYVPKESSKILLEDFQTSHKVIVLYPEVDNEINSVFDEYIIIELFTPTDLNFYARNKVFYGGHGPDSPCIRIWHVDSRLYDLTNKSFTTNPTISDVTIGLSNTTYYNNFSCGAGEEYQKYYQLYSFRNDETIDCYEKPCYQTVFSYNDAFYKGDSFSVEKFNKQFVDVGKLDNGKDLNWSVTIDEIIVTDSGYSAIINVIRN